MARSLRFTGWSLVAVVAVGFMYTVAVNAQAAAEAAKPKYTIKEVMKQSHTPPKEGEKPLIQVVLAGDATPEQKQKLLDLYISLAENDPPKGEKEAWHKKTSEVVLGAAMVVVGRENGADVLKKATLCAGCHKDFKPPAK